MEQKSITYKSKNISYLELKHENNKGFPIVLLHGFLETTKIFLPFIEKLAVKRHVIAIDLPGHGTSEQISDIQTMPLMAEAVLEVIKACKLDKVVVVGHSMGGYVALELCAMCEELVAGIILMNSTACEDDSEKQQNRDRAIKAVESGHKQFVISTISNLFAPQNKLKYKIEIDLLIQEALKIPAETIAATLKGIKQRKNNLDIIKNSDLPIVYIIGTEDPLIPYEKSIEEVSKQFNSFFVTNSNDGHMSYIESETDTINTIHAALEGCMLLIKP